MSVVQRCPSCGTTQATSGECETCHEAQVRYFCTNHEPGIWLSGPTCPQCASRPAPPPRPPASPPPIPSRARPPVLEAHDVELAPSRGARWDELLRGAVLARARAEERPARGWFLQLIGRLAIISVILLAALVLAIYWLFTTIA